MINEELEEKLAQAAQLINNLLAEPNNPITKKLCRAFVEDNIQKGPYFHDIYNPDNDKEPLF